MEERHFGCVVHAAHTTMWWFCGLNDYLPSTAHMTGRPVIHSPRMHHSSAGKLYVVYAETSSILMHHSVTSVLHAQLPRQGQHPWIMTSDFNILCFDVVTCL